MILLNFKQTFFLFKKAGNVFIAAIANAPKFERLKTASVVLTRLASSDLECACVEGWVLYPTELFRDYHL